MKRKIYPHEPYFQFAVDVAILVDFKKCEIIFPFDPKIVEYLIHTYIQCKFHIFSSLFAIATALSSSCLSRAIVVFFLRKSVIMLYAITFRSLRICQLSPCLNFLMHEILPSGKVYMRWYPHRRNSMASFFLRDIRLLWYHFQYLQQFNNEYRWSGEHLVIHRKWLSNLDLVEIVCLEVFQ